MRCAAGRVSTTAGTKVKWLKKISHQMHELARGQTTFIPSFSPTSPPHPCIFLVGAFCVGFDKWTRSDKKLKKKFPIKLLVWHLAKLLSSSCFTRELAQILNNFLQVSLDSHCSLWINLLKIFSVGG